MEKNVSVLKGDGSNERPNGKVFLLASNGLINNLSLGLELFFKKPVLPNTTGNI